MDEVGELAQAAADPCGESSLAEHQSFEEASAGRRRPHKPPDREPLARLQHSPIEGFDGQAQVSHLVDLPSVLKPGQRPDERGLVRHHLSLIHI